MAAAVAAVLTGSSAADFVPICYVLHHALGLDVCCRAVRLELPSAAASPLLTEREGGGEPPHYPGLLEEGEFMLSAQIVCNGLPMHQVPIPSRRSSRGDPQRCTVEWRELLRFPLRYADLSKDAELMLTVWGADGRNVGGASLRLFDEKGTLAQGEQRLLFKMRSSTLKGEGDLVEEARTKYLFPSAEESSDGNAFDADDYKFNLERLVSAHSFGEMPKIGWLDTMSLSRAESLIEAYRSSQSSALRQPHWSDAEWDLRRKAFFVLMMPTFGTPVLYEERPYVGVSAAAPSMELSIAAALPTTLSQENDKSATVANAWLLPTVADWEAEDEESPLEAKYRKLAHLIQRGVIDPDLKPNKDERERIDAVIYSHRLGDHLRVDEKDLLWKFRHCLTDNKKAVTKFLLSVDWALDSEVAQVPGLLNQWHERTSIDFSDALKLLGRERAFQAKVVRDFAVRALQRSSDSQLQTYLLQLVQALRYQPSGMEEDNPSSSPPSTSIPSSPTSDFPKKVVAAAEVEAFEPGDSPTGEDSLSPLAQFLIQRACNSMQLASFLFWYLYVEQSDPQHGRIFRSVFRAFLRCLCATPESTRIIAILRRQKAYVSRIAAAHKSGATTRGRKSHKEAKLQELLQEPSIRTLAQPLPFPLDPDVKVTGLKPEATFMFKSALYPCVIDFTREDPDPVEVAAGRGKQNLDCVDSREALQQQQPKASSYKVIFKSGDDLRQDQLMIQMISLMDGLLKQVNLDLKLCPYRILATGPRDGLVEFVAGSLPISAILRQYGNSILDFLREHNPDDNDSRGVERAAISTFVKSTAGYCVITYLLGIGDRHLDNIMILPDGNLFHIDFGYILGADPKPLAPPFRFTKEMVEAMGGIESANYQKFRSYCCQAYIWLRKSANLILNLLNLMVDAGIQVLSADPITVLGRVEEKFRLDLTDEQAENFFLSLIDESLRAIAPIVLEKMHQFAVARR